MKKYDCVYVFKYCKLEKELTINENIKIIPFDEGLEFSSEFDLIRNVSEKIGMELQADAETQRRLIETQREKVGISILQIKNVLTDNESELFKIVDPYVQNLVSVLSLLKNANIEIFLKFALQMDGSSKIETLVQMKYRSVDYSKRDEIVDHDSVELYLQRVPFHPIIEEDTILKLSNVLYCEYLGEQNRQMRFLRLWLILELQAESKISAKPEKLFLVDDKKKIKNLLIETLEEKEIPLEERDKRIQKVLSVLNYSPIKEKIRALLEQHDIKVEKVDGGKDLTDVMYQLRNCIVHSGGCKKYGGSPNNCKEKFCRDSQISLSELIVKLRNYIIRIIGKDMKIEFKVADV
ncbi:MAG: hypothetical protein V3T58_02960 [Candidatus Hydrothermarchaeales archaeon]